MDLIIIGLVSFGVALLTFFSGFGLGTLLMPIMALFMPIETAIGVTALVHFSNNVFKLLLVGRAADKKTVLWFGLPSIMAALGGAVLLTHLSRIEPLFQYTWGERVMTVTLVKLIIATLIITFTVIEASPMMKNLCFPKNLLPLGGLLSGFFGGLSGHQGAFRSAFLMKTGLTKESLIATGIVLATMVDLSRLSIYSQTLNRDAIGSHKTLLITALLFAFLGSFIGNRTLTKITLKTVQRVISSLLIVIGILLAAGAI